MEIYFMTELLLFGTLSKKLSSLIRPDNELPILMKWGIKVLMKDQLQVLGNTKTFYINKAGEHVKITKRSFYIDKLGNIKMDNTIDSLVAFPFLQWYSGSLHSRFRT